MPELPECEAARRLIETNCLGKTIEEVVTVEEGGGPRDGLFDDIVFTESVSQSTIRSSLSRTTLQAVKRKGKYIWWELSGKHSLLCHFGMTGAFIVMGVEALRYQSFKHNELQWPPRFTKMRVRFKDGTQVAFCDPRRLGRLRLRSNILEEHPVSLLAPDPLTDLPNVEDLASGLQTKSSNIKAVLLDQNAVVSGIGNWCVDDVLYHAGIAPAARAHTLGAKQVESLQQALGEVVKLACEVGADSKKFPSHWLFHKRWGSKRKGKSSAGVDRDGHSIKVETVAGRTTLWVPKVQKMGTGGPSSSAPKPKKIKREKKKSAASTSTGGRKKKLKAKTEPEPAKNACKSAEPPRRSLKRCLASVKGEKAAGVAKKVEVAKNKKPRKSLKKFVKKYPCPPGPAGVDLYNKICADIDAAAAAAAAAVKDEKPAVITSKYFTRSRKAKLG